MRRYSIIPQARVDLKRIYQYIVQIVHSAQDITTVVRKPEQSP